MSISIGAALAGIAGAAAIGYGASYLFAWLRYGRARRPGGASVLLDQFLPAFEVVERQTIKVCAPAAVAFRFGRDVKVTRSRLVRSLFAIRALVMRAKPHRTEQQSLLAMCLSMGWRVLGETPDREIALGAVTQPWQADVVFRGFAPAELVAFREPGNVKIAWALGVEPIDDRTTLLYTETRAATTDAAARARFRPYWAAFSPGIRLIRWELLRLAKRGDAEKSLRTISRR